jgi:hypothetical protein
MLTGGVLLASLIITEGGVPAEDVIANMVKSDKDHA